MKPLLIRCENGGFLNFAQVTNVGMHPAATAYGKRNVVAWLSLVWGNGEQAYRVISSHDSDASAGAVVTAIYANIARGENYDAYAVVLEDREDTTCGGEAAGDLAAAVAEEAAEMNAVAAGRTAR